MEEKSHVGMSICFLCNGPKEVLLDTRLRNTLSRDMLIDLAPCDKCKEWMKQGIILISYDPEKTDLTDTIKLPNPYYHKYSQAVKDNVEDPRCDDKQIDTGTPNFYRTGGWCIVKDDAVKRMPIDEEIREGALKQRVTFMEDEVWDTFELPREEIKATEKENAEV